MRILGFSRKDLVNYLTGNPKLVEDEFTTFRFTRRDKDWAVGELVQAVYKPRRKGGGEFLGSAEITKKEPRYIEWKGLRPATGVLTEFEARADGFIGYHEMAKWLRKLYGLERLLNEPMNKLTLRWVNAER